MRKDYQNFGDSTMSFEQFAEKSKQAIVNWKKNWNENDWTEQLDNEPLDFEQALKDIESLKR